MIRAKTKQSRIKNMSASSDNEHDTKTNYFTPTIASKYINTVFNSPLHSERISSLIYDWLELQAGHIVVDMGCGPGLQSIAMLNKMENSIHVIGKYCKKWSICSSGIKIV